MDTYDIDADGFLLGTANPDRGYPGPVTVAPPSEILPNRARWVNDAWVEDMSREQAAAQAQLQRQAVQAIQLLLDAQAQAWGYDNIFTACTYADEPAVPQFQAEGQALRAWRSATWAACYANQNAASFEALLALLPPAPARPT